MPSHRLSDYDYALPAELIAQMPAGERTGSRLLHVDGPRLEDVLFTDLLHLVRPGDLLVLNDTRVIKSRIRGTKASGGQVELLLERVTGSAEGLFQFRASHPPREGTTLNLTGGAQALVAARNERFVQLQFPALASLIDYLDRHGAVPLPPYIARPPMADDAARYQTVYAHHPGAVAAPTAGLHFDQPLLARLQATGVASSFVTLHVGAGTFIPVQEDDLARHKMHSEWYRIPSATANAISATRRRGGRIIAVGTTSLRALEAAALADGEVRPGEAETTLFITPGFRFRVVDRLLTNFHLPKSTLLVLVCAFAGRTAIDAAYAHAIAQRYRFYSYGDAMLLERAPQA